MSRPDDASPAAGAAWMQRPERSSAAVMRLMVWISLRLGRPLGRLVLHGIAAYFLAFAPAARRASADYLRRVLGRPPRLGERYRHVFTFATTIHDRIYLLNERFDLFQVEVEGEDALQAALADGRGLLLMGAHFGSFEVIRAIGRRHPDLRIAMVMYEENARKVNAALAAINPAAVQDIIPLGRLDSMLQVRDKLEAGYLVGMLADRGLGDDARRRCPFLGTPAAFPLGPFRMAAMLRRPLLLMAGIHLGGNRYRIRFEPLADFGAQERSGREAAIAAAQDRYVQRLEAWCREAPANWFNFFDFWQPAGAD